MERRGTDFSLMSSGLKRRGELRCGPVTIPEVAHDIAPSSDGYVIVSKGSLFPMRVDCELRQTAALGVGFVRRIASAGADGFTMVWRENETLLRRSSGRGSATKAPPRPLSDFRGMVVASYAS